MNFLHIKNSGPGKPGRRRRWRLALLLLACFVLLNAALGLVGYVVYGALYARYREQAQEGMQHLHTATTLLDEWRQHPLDTAPVESARHEFAIAGLLFGQVRDGLAVLPGIVEAVPVYGSRLATALSLARLAVGGTQAGVAGCTILDLLITRLGNPLNTHARGLALADIQTIDQQFALVRTGLEQVLNEANQLSPGDLSFEPDVEKPFAALQGQLPLARVLLRDAESMLPELPALLGVGKPVYYLLEIQDATELRPTGGFIGNYGLATLAGGRLLDAHIRDVDLLDTLFRYAHDHIPYPPAYTWFTHYLGATTWSIRDSNLDADFPTAARYAEQNFQIESLQVERSAVPVEGVIALTPWLIQKALLITGPIYIPEYHETISAQNLVTEIHFHQLGPAGEGSDHIPSPDGHSSLRKRFTELLAEHFLARVHQLPLSTLPRLMSLLFSSLRAKDVQVYLNPPGAESLLQDTQLAGTIQAPQRGDSLFVVDANISPNKANQFIVNTMNDAVTLDSAGNATHVTTLRYAWILPGTDYGVPTYRDYLRVYVPPGSRLIQQPGWQAFGVGQAFGRAVWTGLFTLTYRQVRTLTFVWVVPHAALRGSDGAWHYNYLLQRQAGVPWTWQVQVALPACGGIQDTGGGIALRDRQHAVFTVSPEQDMTPTVDYTCRAS